MGTPALTVERGTMNTILLLLVMAVYAYAYPSSPIGLVDHHSAPDFLLPRTGCKYGSPEPCDAPASEPYKKREASRPRPRPQPGPRPGQTRYAYKKREAAPLLPRHGCKYGAPEPCAAPAPSGYPY